MLTLTVIASYALIFAGGWVFGKEGEVAKQKALNKANARLTTYDRNGRVK